MHSSNTYTDSPGGRNRYALIGLTVYFILVHSAFLIYDYTRGFEPFFRVDRANNRVDAMQHMLAAHTLADGGIAIVTNNIIVGEYILQTGLFRLGGPLAVILFQLALQFCSVFAVYRIARLTLNSSTLSVLSAFIYTTLPHSIVFPHQFSSEAIAVPLVVISFWLVAKYLIEDASWGWLVAAGIFLGMSACVRPVLMFLPACLAIGVIARNRHGVTRDAIGFVIAGAVPLFMVVALFLAITNQVSLGNTVSGMGYNLYLRAMKTAITLPPAEQQHIADQYFSGKMDDNCFGNPLKSDGSACALPVSGYVSFMLHYPLANTRYVFRDLLTFIAKSGVSSITANYLDLSENDEKIMNDRQGWHAVWDSQGLYAAILMVLKANPLAAILELAGGALFLLFFGCFLVGCREIRRMAAIAGTSRPRMIALYALAFLPFYIFATSEVGEYMHSRYRYPCEFAMCILAVLGGAALRHRHSASSQVVAGS